MYTFQDEVFLSYASTHLFLTLSITLAGWPNLQTDVEGDIIAIRSIMLSTAILDGAVASIFLFIRRMIQPLFSAD